MIARIRARAERLAAREDVLLACLVLQALLYWTLAFVIPGAVELVAYQRY